MPFMYTPRPSNDGVDVETSSTTRDMSETVIYPGLSSIRSVLLICTVASAGFLTVLCVQSVVIILPSISEALNIPSSRQGIIVSMYNISLACLMLFWGRAADVYGHRPVYLFGFLLFTVSTLCLPFCGSHIPFYLLRLIQGVGGAAIIPAGLGIVGTTYPPGATRKRAYAIVIGFASLGSVMGSLLGGIIGGSLGWKWVFWIPALLSALATCVAAFSTSSFPLWKSHTKTNSVDWLGAVLISTGLLLLLIAISEGPEIGWKTPWVIALIVLSAVFIASFIIRQRYLEKGCSQVPLLRVSMFQHGEFSALFLLVGCFYGSFNSFLVFATDFYQNYLKLGELHTAYRFVPAGVSGLLVSFVISPALKRIRGFYILLFGLTCGAISPFLFAIPFIPPETTYWAFGFPAMALCCSVEIVWPVISLLVAEALPPEDQALGGGLLQTANNLGRALGLAIATVAQTAIADGQALRGLRAAQWTNVGMVGISFAIGLVYFRKLGKR